MATVYEGRILTVDKIDSVARYLVEDKGLIAYVGNELPQRYEKCDRVELGDDVLVPAFVDTNSHLAEYAVARKGIDLGGAESIGDALDAVSAGLAGCEQGIAIAYGLSPWMYPERRMPNRNELDGVSPEKPLLVVAYDGNAGVVNSKFIDLLDQDTKGDVGFDAEIGVISGRAFRNALRVVEESIPASQLLSLIQEAIDVYASKGFCLVNDAAGLGAKWDGDISFRRWIAKTVQNGFQLRIWPQTFRPAVALKSKICRVGGCFEAALDGTFGGQDAALLEPYANDHLNKGVLQYSDEQVEDYCFQAHNHKLQVAMHAVGDAAFDQAARALARTIDRSFKEAHRHGILHACLPSEEGLDLCAKYGFHLMMQPGFIERAQEPFDYLVDILGEERARRMYPMRTIWDKGIVVSAGSDAPCTEPDAIAWMHAVCNHPDPSQRLTAREALRMCTYNGAWVTYDDDEYGSFEEGKAANMVRLSADPYSVPPEDLHSIQVKETILRGSAYKPQRQGIASVVAKGLLCYGYC